LTRAQNFRRKLVGGQTQPLVFECDDGQDWVLKLMGNPHLGTAGLCAEWIGSCLAKLVDVPVLECDLVEVDEQALSTIPRSSPVHNWAKPGPAFGTPWWEQCIVPPGMDSILAALPSDSDLAGIVVTDTWLDVLDRKKGPAQWNLLRGTGTDSSLVVIDFGLALTEVLTEFVLGEPTLAVRCPNEWKPYVHELGVRRALEKVMNVPSEDITSTARSIPPVWQREVPGSMRVHQYLETRRDRLPSVFEEWLK